MTREQKDWIIENIKRGEKQDNDKLYLWVEVPNMPDHTFTSAEIMWAISEVED